MVPDASEVVARQTWPLASNASVRLSPPGPVKVTVPVGVPDPGALVVTCAQTVTDCPQTEGLGVTETAVVVDAGFTVTDAVPDEPAKQGPSPLYVAVTVPDASAVLVRQA